MDVSQEQAARWARTAESGAYNALEHAQDACEQLTEALNYAELAEDWGSTYVLLESALTVLGFAAGAAESTKGIVGKLYGI